MKECRLCKTTNDDSVAFCRVCGTKFPEVSNQEAVVPESINLLKEIKEIKDILQTRAEPHSAKECKILRSNPHSSSETEEFAASINTYLSQGWIITGFTYAHGNGSLYALLSR